jgi:hypothetical protein
MCFAGCMKERVSRPAFSALFALGAGLVFAQAAMASGPAVNYTVAPAKPVAKSPFHVTYEVRWEGGAESLGVIPAEPAAVVWGTGRLSAAKSVSSADGQVLQYTVEYVPDRAGEVQVPPLALSYVLEPPLEERAKVVADASAASAAAKDRVPQSLEAPGFSVKVGRNFGFGWVLGGAGGIALVAGLALAGLQMRRKRRTRVAAPAEGSTVQSLLNLARQHRLDGKFYEYYRELARVTTLMAPSVAAKKLREKFEQDAQQVGYGALRPTEDSLEGALRDLDRVLREQTQTDH